MSDELKPQITHDEKILADFLTMTCGRLSPAEDETLYGLIGVLIRRSVSQGPGSFYTDSLERCEAIRNATIDAIEGLGIPTP